MYCGIEAFICYSVASYLCSHITIIRILEEYQKQINLISRSNHVIFKISINVPIENQGSGKEVHSSGMDGIMDVSCMSSLHCHNWITSVTSS